VVAVGPALDSRKISLPGDNTSEAIRHGPAMVQCWYSSDDPGRPGARVPQLALNAKLRSWRG